MRTKDIRNLLTIIAITALIIGFLSLIGSTDRGSDEPAVADIEQDGDVVDGEGAEALEQMVLDSEKLQEIEPAAGSAKNLPEKLPSNKEVSPEVFGFQ